MSLAPQSIVTALQALTPTKYSWVASLCLILYDHLITLDLEVEHVWNRPRSLSRPNIFTWNNLINHRRLATSDMPHSLWRSQVYAVYNRNKHILYGVVGFRVLMTAATVILWVFYIPSGLGPPPIDGITGCLSPTTSRLFAYSFLPTMSNEVILCLFMLYKAWLTYKYNYGSLLLEALIQDRSASLLSSLIISLAALTLDLGRSFKLSSEQMALTLFQDGSMQYLALWAAACFSVCFNKGPGSPNQHFQVIP
ncbi:hypothetical protein JB92DRAFT_3071259 [Gautieria morchelliformis]|nr:hypothetical protein JB92DRAFT_3071259 [Gautieria morchelliformis]